MSILRRIKGVSACVACSSKRKLNVREVFHFAAAAAAFPIEPLANIDTTSRRDATNDRTHPSLWQASSCDTAVASAVVELKPACKMALERIFRMADAQSCDGVLDYYEYSKGIQACFPATFTSRRQLPPTANAEATNRSTASVCQSAKTEFDALITTLQSKDSELLVAASDSELGMTLEALPAGLPEAGGQLRDIHNNLDAFYISSKLRQACAMLSRRNLYQGDFEPEMLSEVLEHLQRRPYADPLIVLYRLAAAKR